MCAAYCHVMLVSVIVLQNLACFRGRYTQRGGGGYCVAGVLLQGLIYTKEGNGTCFYSPVPTGQEMLAPCVPGRAACMGGQFPPSHLQTNSFGLLT